MYTNLIHFCAVCVGGVHAGADHVAAAALQPQPGLS